MTLAEDLELLGAVARRHLETLGPRGSVHVSAAVDALTDPLAPPDLVHVDDSATADLRGVLHTVRARLEDAATRSPDPAGALRLAVAARELVSAMAVLPPSAPSVGGPPSTCHVTKASEDR
jgi:hypothetical protein